MSGDEKDLRRDSLKLEDYPLSPQPRRFEDAKESTTLSEYAVMPPSDDEEEYEDVKRPTLSKTLTGLSVADSIDSVDSNVTYTPLPLKAQPRRNNAAKTVTTTAEIKLTDGNLVIDLPVPERLKNLLARRESEEFTHMRYTACTSDPDDFMRDGFTLRPAAYGRETELFIVCTMYNEDEILFTRTLHGIMKNVAHLCSRTKSRTWGVNGWKKVVVCIVADGRKNVHPRVLDCLSAIGVYQEGVAQQDVDGAPVKAHIYEYTTQFSLDSRLHFKGGDKGITPVQVMFCLVRLSRSLPRFASGALLTVNRKRKTPRSSTRTGGSSTALDRCSTRTSACCSMQARARARTRSTICGRRST